jgi:hypothetical protein
MLETGVNPLVSKLQRQNASTIIRQRPTTLPDAMF